MAAEDVGVGRRSCPRKKGTAARRHLWPIPGPPRDKTQHSCCDSPARELPYPLAIGHAPLDLLFLSGDDMRALALSDAEVFEAVEAAVRAQGEGAVTLDPRVHHVPDATFPGHFNVLRATVWPLEATGVKVVGDYVQN